MPHLPPHTLYTDLPISGMPPGSPVYVLFRYMLQTLVDRTAYTTMGFKTVPCQHFSLVLGTTKSHRGTGQGCMGDDLRHRAQILSDIPVP